MAITTTCPGCGLVRPRVERPYARKFHANAECWDAFERVVAHEFENAVLFAQVHQRTVDAYAVQHAGGTHPDKSVCVHLCGLLLVIERGIAPARVPPLLQRLAARAEYPHLEPPSAAAGLTIGDVLGAPTPEEHAARVRAWSDAVWRAWTPYHGVARELVRGVLAG